MVEETRAETEVTGVEAEERIVVRELGSGAVPVELRRAVGGALKSRLRLLALKIDSLTVEAETGRGTGLDPSRDARAALRSSTLLVGRTDLRLGTALLGRTFFGPGALVAVLLIRGTTLVVLRAICRYRPLTMVPKKLVEWTVVTPARTSDEVIEERSPVA